ncbi:uncharacterized protein LOC119107723 [Pollicipes pollicipes]|uniref:uncharacterized protein LOC119107723 n=1 Tax=Pollicipes pollicipes TaxID=41117 RepID=UPI0018853A31|nr:uncharacterized protein LOC119107723 [Pollicipes pollicipes]
MCRCSLTCHDLSLWHKEPWRFVTTRWQYPGRKSTGYLCYRLAVACFFFVWTVIDMATYAVPGQRSRWLIHITNWSKLFVMIDVVLQAAHTCHYQLWKLRKRPPGRTAVPGAYVLQEISFNPLLRFLYGIQWFFTNVSGVFAVVTVNVAFIEDDSSGAFRAARYFTSLLYVLLDHLVHNQPKHMLHVFYSLFLHVIYIVFNAIYVMAGGTTASGSSVIDGIDWSNTATTSGFVSLSVFLVFLAHGGLWLLARLREVLYSCLSDEHAIKLPLGTTGPPPYGAMRQDPEGGHPSPVIKEKQSHAGDRNSPTSKATPIPGHQPLPAEVDPAAASPITTGSSPAGSRDPAQPR